MSKKIIPIIGICMVILGGILAAFFRNPMRETAAESENYTEKQCAYAVEEIERLILTGSVGNIEVTAYDGDKILLTWYESKHMGWDIALRDGILSAERRESMSMISMVRMNAEYDILRVNMPRGCAKAAEITASTGAILCADIPFTDLTASCSTGDILVRNSETENIALSASTGTITASSVRCVGDGVFSASTGTILLRDTEIAGSVSTVTTTGKLTANHVRFGNAASICSTGGMSWNDATVENLSITSTTGDVILEGLSARNAEIECSTGDVRGTMAHPVTEYDIVSETSTGESNLPTICLGTRKLRVTTSTGDIQIEFAK